MNNAGYLWAIERIDGEGEPAPAGEFLKLGLRQAGEVRAIWVDILDAEALAATISALMKGAPPPGALVSTACEQCRKPIAPGAPAYLFKPGGGPCLKCEACAPTVSEEVAGIVAYLSSIAGGNPGAGALASARPAGFRDRLEAAAWVARVRVQYPAQVKRLAPFKPPADPQIENDLQFKEPPATARLITESDLER